MCALTPFDDYSLPILFCESEVSLPPPFGGVPSLESSHDLSLLLSLTGHCWKSFSLLTIPVFFFGDSPIRAFICLTTFPRLQAFPFHPPLERVSSLSLVGNLLALRFHPLLSHPPFISCLLLLSLFFSVPPPKALPVLPFTF